MLIKHVNKALKYLQNIVQIMPIIIDHEYYSYHRRHLKP